MKLLNRESKAKPLSVGRITRDHINVTLAHDKQIDILIDMVRDLEKELGSLREMVNSQNGGK